LRAFATTDGRLLWEYNMIHDYDTVNHVAAKGGSMGAPGPTVAAAWFLRAPDTFSGQARRAMCFSRSPFK